MAGFAQRLRDAFLKPAQQARKKAIAGREERSTNPTEAEKVVVRPARKVKKRKLVK